jgi:hypothetical protein
VDVIAFCNRQVDHLATALLTAAVMDEIGGVAHLRMGDARGPVVAGLPGVVAERPEPFEAVFATAEFLRGWAARPGFRLPK